MNAFGITTEQFVVAYILSLVFGTFVLLLTENIINKK